MNIKIDIYKDTTGYTLIIDNGVYALNEAPLSAQGVNQFMCETFELDRAKLGKKLNLEELSNSDVKRAVIDRVTSVLEGYAEL